MPDPTPVHTDRRRAQAFGAVALDYDRYRPRYPQALITRIVPRPGVRVLDVGAGTGISSMQLAGAGARVLAIEPDDRMADVCAAKGITVERGLFEEWDPAGRRYDTVVFGQSFHWVQPGPALAKIAGLLTEGGSLVLMWNRVAPATPSHADLAAIYADYPTAAPSSPNDPDGEAAVIGEIESHGFRIERAEFEEQLHYSTDDWVRMVSTNSNHLILQTAQRTELSERLTAFIGPAGVSAHNRALALFCTTHQAG
jgi:SAM-dependent methyltransferase